ncbi:regulator of microtubule dynamics protein 3 [Pelobates fuscus]|uniref:regulator of microtubule dynamics protein 3 n=1 Tax=Pelobates fuscus TaxID=191477 RepID=UPI002FE44A0D
MMSKLLLTYRLGCGLICGTAAAVVIYLVYRRSSKKNNTLLSKQAGYCINKSSDRSTNPSTTHSQAALGEAVNKAVTHGEQLELLSRLDDVLSTITVLREEVETLRNSLHELADDIVEEVRSQIEESQKAARRRRYPLHRERTDSTGSSSIYFTTSSGPANTDIESEGGYTTANAESDYDRESFKASEEEDEISCETIRTIRRDSADLTSDDGDLTQTLDCFEDKLTLLVQKVDQLYNGDSEQKKDSFQLLRCNKGSFGENQDFLWRLARAYSDMCENAEDLQKKRAYAMEGKLQAEQGLESGNASEDGRAENHKWLAILCEQLAEHESIHWRILLGCQFKEHIEKAISLNPTDPRCYYLLGRWCYQICNLDLSEIETISGLLEKVPKSSVQEALQNFLKAEEMMPDFSKALRIYIAKCYKDLGNDATAAHWLKTAAELPNITREDREMSASIEEMSKTTEEVQLL